MTDRMNLAPLMFMGFVVTEDFSQVLKTIPTDKTRLFIKTNTLEYLQEYESEDGLYLGKFVGKITNIHTLYSLEKNIYSLLRKIVPDFPYESTSLHLLVTNL